MNKIYTLIKVVFDGVKILDVNKEILHRINLG